MEYYCLEIIHNPAMPWHIYMGYYDIDISPIFTDKTTYFHWLPKDLINIIESYDLYDIKNGDKIYSNKLYRYYRTTTYTLHTADYFNNPIFDTNLSNPIFDTNLSETDNIGYYDYISLKCMLQNNSIKVYRKKPPQPPSSCNII